MSEDKKEPLTLPEEENLAIYKNFCEQIKNNEFINCSSSLANESTRKLD